MSEELEKAEIAEEQLENVSGGGGAQEWNPLPLNSGGKPTMAEPILQGE